MKNSKSFFSNKLNLLILCFLFTSYLGLVIDVQKTNLSPGKDLLIRVTGSRVFQSGVNPYAYFVDKLTITPSVLFLELPFTSIPYNFQRYSWLCFQWLMLISVLLIFISITKSRIKRKLMLLSFLIFSSSVIWRWHVDAGQIYILYTLLAALAYKILLNRSKFSDYLSGFVIGITTTLRPTFLIFLPTTLVFRKFKFLMGYVVGIVVGFLPPIFIKSTIWYDYLSAMFYQSNAQLRTIFAINSPDYVSGDMYRATLNSSFQSIFRYLFSVNLSVWFLILMFTLLAVSTILFVLNKRSYLPITSLFMLSYLLALLSDFFLPAARYNYFDIQWLLIISYLILILNENDFLKKRLNLLWILIVTYPPINILASYILVIYSVSLFIPIYSKTKLKSLGY